MMMSGGNRNPANADAGSDQGEGQDRGFTDQVFLDLANSQRNGADSSAFHQDHRLGSGLHQTRGGSERYADDAAVHCVTERQARQVLGALEGRSETDRPHRAAISGPDAAADAPKVSATTAHSPTGIIERAS